jgi:chromosome partitioning protein
MRHTIISISDLEHSSKDSFFAVNLAKNLVKSGRVLLFDLDPQGFSSKNLKVHQNFSIFNILNRNKDFFDVVKKSGIANFFILPANIDVAKIDKEPKLLIKMREVLKYLKTKFNFIVIDTPPYLNTMIKNIVEDAEKIYIVVDLKQNSLYSTEKRLKELENFNNIKLIPINYSDNKISSYSQIIDKHSQHLIKFHNSFIKIEEDGFGFQNLYEKIINE